MNIDLCDEALAYGQSALHAFEHAGGDELAQAVPRQTRAARGTRRAGAGEPGRVGAGAARESATSWKLLRRCAAAPGGGRCRTRWPNAWPGLPTLTWTVSSSLPTNARRGPSPALSCAGQWSTWPAAGTPPTAGPAADPPGPPSSSPTSSCRRPSARTTALDTALDIALGLVLPCWTLLGMLDRAMALTRTHVLSREQFGQPLARFQGVQFQLTDAEVERAGVEELAKYALWSVETERVEVVADALALRLAALEAADRLPGQPPTARSHGLLRRNHALLDLPLQPSP